MGAIIKSVSTAEPGSGTSYRDLGSEAVIKCLDNEFLGKETLDLLISTGIYPDDHIHEPAFAALIQGNLSKSHAAILSGTFSFDLHSGGGGSLMALRLINGFISSGKMQYGLVVAGDSRPIGGPAGAIMLGKGNSDEGFQAFVQNTYSQYSGDYESYSEYTGNVLETFINQEDTYLEHSHLCVEKSVQNFLSELSLGLEEIDLIIPCQSPAGFVSGLVDIFTNVRIIDLKKEQSGYSAGLLLALAIAHAKAEFNACKRILLINSGPGIMVDLALYVNPERI
jgi:3-oxoacyl-[acyl-carrier-protein] synthase III